MKNVLILNFGGPIHRKDVRPFLKELFSDTVGIRMGMPAFVQKNVVAPLIAWRRSPSVEDKYDEIGGGSPLVPMTGELVKLLNQNLPDYRFYLGMRYTAPRVEETLKQMQEDGVEDAFVLPLYPHYSIATVESSMEDVRMALKSLNYHPTLRPLCKWYDFPPYIKAMSHQIQKGLEAMQDKNPVLLFSAHGVPVSYIEEGDPYQKHVEETVKLILEDLRWKGKHLLGWQSRVGPAKWLTPSMDEILENPDRFDLKSCLVIPVSFVGDHIETLHEIDIEYKEVAEKHGIKEFGRMPSLNTEPVFVECLTELIQTRFATKSCPVIPCRCGFLKNMQAS